MPVRGIGIRDVSAVLCVSITTVLKALKSTNYKIKPKRNHDDRLEIGEFWTYAGKKQNTVRLIYAYHRDTGKIAASNLWFAVRGKRDLKTALKLKKRIKQPRITYDRIAAADRNSFPAAFAEDCHDAGKKHTVGIEGNNCRLRPVAGRYNAPAV
jgi:IS1 family transposase